MKLLQIYLAVCGLFLYPTGSKQAMFIADANTINANTLLKNYGFDNNDRYDFSTVTMAQVDAEADLYTPPNRVYTYDEAIKLRRNLEQQVLSNKKSIGLYWALLRFYSGSPDFIGGTPGFALQYAAYIYSMNPYIGCLAYEFAYTKYKDPIKAHEWYERSLSTSLPGSMVWEEIKYNNTVQTAIKVSGNFNNWKLQNMYETKGGTYNRRVMMPKCETCQYKVFVDYTSVHQPSSTRESLIFNN